MKSKWTLVGMLTLALLASAVLPGLATAEPNAVLYEVTENLKLAPLAKDHRNATAALSGTVAAGTTICPAVVAAAYGKSYCVVTATASNNTSLVTGSGQIEGSFQVLLDGDNATDGPELVVLRGTFRGKGDLRMAVLGPDGIPMSKDEVPLGFLTGRWSARGVRGGPLDGIQGHGPLTGTFRLPFEMVLPAPFGCHFDGDPSDCTGTQSFSLYLQDNGLPTPVRPEEHSLGVPTVKLEITFEDKD
jgi:hypothetical protein